MAYNQKNYLKQAATGVFHTDGIGVTPNNPSVAYGVWNSTLANQDVDITKGKAVLRQFNQTAQMNEGPLASRNSYALGRAYGNVFRAYS